MQRQHERQMDMAADHKIDARRGPPPNRLLVSMNDIFKIPRSRHGHGMMYDDHAVLIGTSPFATSRNALDLLGRNLPVFVAVPTRSVKREDQHIVVLIFRFEITAE